MSKGAKTKDFIEYVIGDGQAVTTQLHYSKLPPSLVQIDKALLDKVQPTGH
jgi:hypothetical protein